MLTPFVSIGCGCDDPATINCPDNDVVILSQSPPSGAVEVPVGSNLLVTLNTTPILTVEADHFRLVCGGGVVQGEGSFDGSSITAIFNPEDDLPPSSTCEVTLASELVCSSGQVASWEFATAGETGSAGLMAPSPPEGLTATAGASGVTLDWDSAEGATAYNLYFEYENDSALGIMAVVTKETGARRAGVVDPYLDADCAVGATCCYVVTAANALGESDESEEVCAVREEATYYSNPADDDDGSDDNEADDDGSPGDDGASSGEPELLCASDVDQFGRAIVTNGTTLFWIAQEGSAMGRIQSCPVGGGEVTTLYETIQYPAALAISGAALYFTVQPGSEEEVDGSLQRMSITGEGRVTLVPSIAGAGLDLEEGLLFYADSRSPNGDILRVTTEGASVTSLIGSCTPDLPYDLVVTDGGDIVFTEYASGRVRLLQGGACQNLVTGLERPRGLLLSSSDVYYVSGGYNIEPIADGSLRRYNLDTDTETVLDSGLVNVGHTTVCGDEVYYTEKGPVAEPGGRVKRIAADGTVTTCASERDLPSALLCLGSDVIWIEERGVYRLPQSACD